MKKIKVNVDSIVNMNIKKNAIVVINSDIEIITLKSKNNGKKIILLKKRNKGIFVDIDKSPKYKNIYKKKSVAVAKSIVNKSFYDVNPEDWRPKHIVQYVKNKYEITFNSIPLELQWDDKGYSENARSRSKSWAHAKHLFDKMDKVNINRKRIRHYIDWCFEFKNIPPTMALISCDNWIDSYNFEFRNKRIRQSKIVEVDRKSTRLNSSHTDISRMPSSA